MTTDFRRASDQEDHDSLVELKANMKYLCEAVKDIKAMQKEQAISCACRARDCNRFFVPSKIFYVTIVLLVGFIASVGAVTWDVKEDLAVHKVHYERMIDSADGNIPDFDIEQY